MQMKMRTVLGCVSGVVVTMPALAGDLLSYVTDIRRCTASYSGNGSATCTESRREPFEFWEGGANLNVTNGLETWVTSAQQRSDLDGVSVTFDGSGTTLAIAAPLSNPLQALAQSKLDLFFTVEAPTRYELFGRVAEGGCPDSLSRVVLSMYATGNPVLQSVTTGAEGVAEFSWSGTLEPGMYRLEAEASARSRTVSPVLLSEGVASCTMEFRTAPAVWCSSDWDRDGAVASPDAFAFLEDFFGDGADFNTDGRTDSSDFFGFLAAFLTGC
jgi:hypothetical protein